jgi:PST family polysaccharide transporter
LSLLSSTVSAVAWTTVAKVIQQVFQFVLSVVLMRLLGPEAFGLIGMVLVFSGFAGIFSELGFGSALVQRQDVREEHRSTAFWLTIAMSVVLTVAFAAAAPLVAGFYKQPLLKSMTAWSALGFVLAAPGVVPRALLQKAMRFDALAKVDIAALAISGATATAIAALGGGVWSLVVQQIVSSAATSILLLLLGNWRPRLIWSRDNFRQLFGYGAGLTGFNVINYWARSADKLLIGTFLGPIALGLYSRAYALMLLPISQVISVLAPVMFPAMSSIQHDKPRARRVFLRVITVLSFLTFPMMLGLVVVAEPFVLTFFGAKWASVTPIIQILALVGVTQTLCNPTGWIYTSQGRTDWMFWWGVGGAGFLILSIIAGIFLGGTREVALAYLVGNLVIAVPCIAIPGRLIGMSVGDVWSAIRGNLLCGLTMAGLVWGVAHLLPAGSSPVVRLSVQVATGILAYAGLISLTHQPVLHELARLRSSRVASSALAASDSTSSSDCAAFSGE